MDTSRAVDPERDGIAKSPVASEWRMSDRGKIWIVASLSSVVGCDSVGGGKRWVCGMLALAHEVEVSTGSCEGDRWVMADQFCC